MFNFKQFSIDDSNSAMKVGTDAVLLGSWVDLSNITSVIDAGCGSGVLSLMMAQRLPKAKIYAIDIDPGACMDCKTNIEASRFDSVIEVINDDVTTCFPDVESPKLIISNPPFFSESLRSPKQSRAVARHGDTFDIEALISLSAKYLPDSADSLAFISPVNRTDEIDFQLEMNRLKPKRITTVYSRDGKPPIRKLWQVVADSGGLQPLEVSNLYIRDKENNFTVEYLTLTNQFYIDK